MKCSHIYTIGHPDVKSGKVVSGSQCRLTAIDERGFCHNHLAESGLCTEEELKQYREKKNSAAEAKRSQVRNARIADRLEKQEADSEAEASYTKNLLSAVKDGLTIHGFDLKDFYDFVDNIGVAGGDKSYKRQWSFAHWLLADADDKTPQTIEEVGEILGISTEMLWRWQRGDTMDKFLRRAREDMLLKNGEPFYFAWIYDGVKSGDKDALKEFVKIREKRAPADDGKPAEVVPDDVMAEAVKVLDGAQVIASPIVDAIGWGETDES